MPLPNDVEILTVIDLAKGDYENGLVPVKRILDAFPDAMKGVLIRRLTALSSHRNDVLDDVPGNDGGFRITGNAGHASNEETASWIIQWSQKNV